MSTNNSSSGKVPTAAVELSSCLHPRPKLLRHALHPAQHISDHEGDHTVVLTTFTFTRDVDLP